MAGGELFDVYTDQDFWGQAVGWPQRMSGGGWFQDCPFMDASSGDRPGKNQGQSAVLRGMCGLRPVTPTFQVLPAT